MATEKEERSEYVGLYVTPTFAKELKLAGDNDKLKQDVLKRFITNETDWLKEEMKSIDEITLTYSAKLITLRDNFEKVQNGYVEEIEKMCDMQFKAFKPVEDNFKKLQQEAKIITLQAEETYKEISKIDKAIGYIDYSKLEKLLLLVEKYNTMSDKEKELIKMLLKNE